MAYKYVRPWVVGIMTNLKGELVGAIRHSDMNSIAKKLLLRALLKFGREKK